MINIFIKIYYSNDMKIVKKLIILILFIGYSYVEVLSDSNNKGTLQNNQNLQKMLKTVDGFKLTCDFGINWDKFTPRVQTHIVINDKAYFEENNKLATLIENQENKIKWSYKYNVGKKLKKYAQNNLYSQKAFSQYSDIGCSEDVFPIQYLEYSYFKSTNKLNIENKIDPKLKRGFGYLKKLKSGHNTCTIEENGWGSCKREPLNISTLALFKKANPKIQINASLPSSKIKSLKVEDNKLLAQQKLRRIEEDKLQILADKSFKLTCDFGSDWNNFTPQIQTHIIIDNKVYFEENNKQSKLTLKNKENKFKWTYKLPFETYKEYLIKNHSRLIDKDNSLSTCINDKPVNYSQYVYFTSTNKINIETKSSSKKPKRGYFCKLPDDGWGNCKKEPLDKVTLSKYYKKIGKDRLKIIAEENTKKIEDEKIKIVSQNKKKQLEEDKFRILAEKNIKKIEEEKIKIIYESKKKQLEEEKARLIAEEKARKLEAENKKLLAQQKLRKLEEDRLRILAEENTKKIEEEKRKIISENRNKQLEEEKARLIAEEKARKLEAENKKLLAQQKLRKLEEDRLRILVEENTKKIEEENKKLLEKEKQKRLLEQKGRLLAEEKARRLLSKEKEIEIQKDFDKKLAQLEKKIKNKNFSDNDEIGSGFFVSKLGHIVTNKHVVNKCDKITVGYDINNLSEVSLVASDKRSDLAILQTISMEIASAETKTFIQNLSVEILPIVSKGLIRNDDIMGGEEIIVAGYPLGNIVSDTIKVTKGIVSATKGMDNDVSQFEIDAVIRKGNSGGPIYDKRGNIVGIAVSRLNVNRTDTINFGIKGSTVKQFLATHDIPTKSSNRKINMTTQDLYKIASKQTVMVVCHRE